MNCHDCNHNRGIMCESCKAERRRLVRLHRWWAKMCGSPADAAERDKRVEAYADIVAAGGRLFEECPV